MNRTFAGMVACALVIGSVSAEEPFTLVGTYRSLGGQFASVVAPGPAPGSDRLYATYLYVDGSFEVTSVDPDTGDLKVLSSPVKGEYGARCMAVGPDGNVYLGTIPTAHFVKLDTGSQTLVDLGRPSASEQYIWDVGFGSDGKLYGSTYPGAKLVRYDPATGRLDDLGRMDPAEQYARYLATSKDGFVYTGIGTRKMNVAAYSIATGEHREILPEKYQAAGTAQVYRGPDGMAYAIAGDRYFRLEGWKAEPIDKAAAAPRVGSNRTRDGRTVILETRSISVLDPKVGRTKKTPYGYGGREVSIYRLGPGPDGLAYASSVLPARLLRMGRGGAGIEDLGELGAGEVYRFLPQGGRLLMAAYSCAAPLMSFDPMVPFQAAVPQNPALVTFAGQDKAWRPQAFVAGPDGRVYVGAIAGYGKLAGQLCEWSVGPGLVNCVEGVVPEQGISALAAWKALLVGGSTIVGGGGSTPTQKTAKLFLWDPSTRKVIFSVEPVPGAGTIENLVVAPSGLVYGIAGRKPFRFDVEKRVVSPMGELPFPGASLPGALGVGPDGRIWGLGGHPDAGVFSIDPKDGQIALVAKSPAPISAGFAILGNHLYFASEASVYRFLLPSPSPGAARDRVPIPR